MFCTVVPYAYAHLYDYRYVVRLLKLSESPLMIGGSIGFVSRMPGSCSFSHVSAAVGRQPIGKYQCIAICL